MIVIAEDDESTQWLLVRWLKAHGYPATAVADGAALTQYLRDHLPSLVILDQIMPDLSGLEVLRRMRSDPRLCAVPVVMFTGSGDPAMFDEARDAGADAVLIKNGDLDGLTDAVRRLMGRGRSPAQVSGLEPGGAAMSG